MSRILCACGRHMAPAAWPRPCPAHTDRTGSLVVHLPIVLELVHGTTTVITRQSETPTHRRRCPPPQCRCRDWRISCLAYRSAVQRMWDGGATAERVVRVTPQ